MLRLELPDRSDLEIVVPDRDVRRAPDRRPRRRPGAARPRRRRPCGRLVRRPRAGRRRALPGRLPLPAPVRARAAAHRRRRAGAARPRSRRSPSPLAVEGHDDEVADAAGYAARLAELRRGGRRWSRRTAPGAAARVGDDEDLAELVGFLLVGEGSGRSRDPNPPAMFSGNSQDCVPMMRVWHGLRRFTKTERAAHWLDRCCVRRDALLGRPGAAPLVVDDAGARRPRRRRRRARLPAWPACSCSATAARSAGPRASCAGWTPTTAPGWRR